MGTLDWLDNCSGRSTDELLGMQGQLRKDVITLAFAWGLERKLDQGGDDRSARLRWAKVHLTEPELVVLAVAALEREVNNGGYDQFFVNAMEYAFLVVDALEQIGCHETAAITRRAVAALQISGPTTIESIERVIYDDDDVRKEVFDACDTEYFEKAGCLGEPLFDFIRANKHSVRLP